MNPITAIIVDDEKEGIDMLAYTLAHACPEVKVIGKYQSSPEALIQIKKLRPELLFLDINMPHINGLQLLELAGASEFKAIFTTAYDEFVLQALRLNALDYLKKPVEDEELKNAVARAQQLSRLSPQQVENSLELIQRLEIGVHTKIGIKEGNKINFVSLTELNRAESDANFSNVLLAGGSKIYSSYSLGTLEEILPESYFFRTHREHIVNGLHIKSYDRANGSVLMSDGKLVPVARSRREDFLEFISGFLMNLNI